MPKHGFLTPKAISNRMKSKGLQKLRWFCQMCQKQCRDENGFKCHTMSESHQRQMLIFANNPDKIMDEYSRMFEEHFLDLLSRRHGVKRMRANVVYQEYIADKMHVHMNSTQWETLSTFVQYLGRTGKCVVDETEKGWYIQYIDRDPAAIARQKERDKRRKAALDDEEKNRLFVEQQIAAAEAKKQEMKQQAGGAGEEAGKSTIIPEGAEKSIEVKLGPKASSKKKPSMKMPIKVFGSDSQQQSDQKSKERNDSDSLLQRPNENGDSGRLHSKSKNSSDVNRGMSGSAVSLVNGKGRKRSAAELLIEEDKKRKLAMVESGDKKERKDYWISRDIIVKVLNKKVGGGNYYKKKGTVVKVEQKYIGHVKMSDSGHVLKIDQDDLETVVPEVNRRVKIVNGFGRGQVARLLSIDVENYCGKLKLDEGPDRGLVLERVEYEDFCKLNEDTYKEHRRDMEQY